MLSPKQITEGMFRKPRPYNLNEQAFDVVYSLLQRVLSRCKSVKEVVIFVDVEDFC